MARDEYDDRDRDRDRDRDDRDDRDRDDDRPRRRRRYDDDDALSHAELKRKVKAPAICLIIIGVIYLGFSLWSGVYALVFFDQQWEQAIAQQQKQRQGDPKAQQAAEDMLKAMKPAVQWGTVGLSAVFGLLSAFVIFGAVKMLTGSSRGWGMTSAIIAILPLNCYVWVFGIAFGIWALVVLSDPRVKAAFARGGAPDRESDDDRRDDRDDDRRDDRD